MKLLSERDSVLVYHSTVYCVILSNVGILLYFSFILVVSNSNIPNRNENFLFYYQIINYLLSPQIYSFQPIIYLVSIESYFCRLLRIIFKVSNLFLTNYFYLRFIKFIRILFTYGNKRFFKLLCLVQNTSSKQLRKFIYCQLLYELALFALNLSSFSNACALICIF